MAIRNLLDLSVLELLTLEEFTLLIGLQRGREKFYKNSVDNINTTSDVHTTSLNVLLNKMIGRPMVKSCRFS